MRVQSRIRLLKYAVKSAILGHTPRVYWFARQVIKGHHEPELALLPQLADPERAAFDIGAHFGMWTSALLPHFREVHAFEPIPRLARVLRSGVGGRARVHEVALSDHAGTTTLRAPRAGLGRSTVEPRNDLEGMSDPTQPVDVFDVRTMRLDDMGLPDPAFIKIDVEGHELAVVEGGKELIARARPTMLIELVDCQNPGYEAAIIERLEGMGFHATRLPGSRNVIFRPDGAPPLTTAR